MKKMQLYFVALLLTATTLFSSCKTSKVWETKDRDRDRDNRSSRIEPAPPPQVARSYRTAALIIVPTPGFTMNKSNTGHYYHRSRGGLLYWKGYDNRFFLDRSFVHRASYSEWEYDQWKRYSRSR